MDRALLERMIGAVVLVLLFVVFVPALLDGRDDEASLGRSSDDKTRTAVIVLNAPSDESQQALQSEQVAEKQKTLPEPVPEPSPKAIAPVPKTAVEPAPVSKAPPPPPPAKPKSRIKKPPDKGFAVQLGSFGSRDNAVSFATGLRDKGYPVFVVRGAADKNEVYRVFAGPRPTRSDAEELAARLKKAGQNVLVVDLEARAGG